MEKDDDHFTDRMREERMLQLKREQLAKKSPTFGSYETINEEKKLMLMTTTTKTMVIHFAHKNFKRCRIMDQHMEILARKYPTTRFVRVYVENVPFLVDRMDIKVLPCVVSFIDGVGVDRLIGFEGVAEGDQFASAELEARLSLSSKYSTNTEVIKVPTAQRILKFANPESDEDDWN